MATEQEKNRRVAEQLRLIDDDFLRLYFNDNPEGVEYILNILLERQDLKVLHSETQCEYRSLSGRSISLDIYAEDTNGKRYQTAPKERTVPQFGGNFCDYADGT